MAKLCCIVGAGDVSENELIIPENAYVIAADAGLNALLKRGLEPDLTVGDFDSLGYVPVGENVLRVPAEKDDTDLLLAVKRALETGCDTFIIYGGLGGRFDHSLANMQTLKYIAQQGSAGYLVGGGCVCTVLINGVLEFAEERRGIMSVFSMGTALGVTLEGVKYPLHEYTMTDSFPIGVSNELEGRGRVSVRDGALAVVWQAEGFDVASVRRL